MRHAHAVSGESLVGKLFSLAYSGTRSGAAMDRARPLAIKAAVFLAGIAAILEAPALPTGEQPGRRGARVVSQVAAKIIAEAIPREYERTKDWGHTKEVTSGSTQLRQLL